MESNEINIFYTNLLNKALDEIGDEKVCMVLGPIFKINKIEENFTIFNKKFNELNNDGKKFFNQLPYLDYSLKNAPFDYEKKFEIFYKGLIGSGKITEVFLLPGWQESEGTRTEVKYCLEFKIKIHYPII